MIFTWSCHSKILSILTPRYFTEFYGYNLFLLSLTFISPGSTFLGDLKITSLVCLHYQLKFYFLSINYSDVSYHSWLAY